MGEPARTCSGPECSLCTTQIEDDPENLSRAFKGLLPYGVSVEGTRININDQTDLERFAKPNPLIDDFST